MKIHRPEEAAVPDVDQNGKKIKKCGKEAAKNAKEAKQKKEQNKNIKHPLTLWMRLTFFCKTLYFLTLVSIFIIPMWFICLVFYIFCHGSWQDVKSDCSIVILGARSPLATHIARHFRKMGYKVIGMETKRYMTASMSWSRACDKFYWLPDPLEPPVGDGPEDYVEHLWTLLYELKPTLFIPLNKMTIIEDQEVTEKLGELLPLLAIEPIQVAKLADTNQFFINAEECSNKIPEYKLINNMANLKLEGFDFVDHSYVYKLYRLNKWGCKKVPTPTKPSEVSDLVKLIGVHTPVLQMEKLEGPVIKCSSLFSNRMCVAQAVSQRVGDRIVHVNNRQIREWVTMFVERYTCDISGWISFEFMKSTEEDIYYPINCKPWIEESFMLLHEDSSEIIERLEMDSYQKENMKGLLPVEGTTIRCLAEDLYRIGKSFYNPFSYTRWFSNNAFTDVLFLKSDPIPWFITYFFDVPIQVWLNWRAGNYWESIDLHTNTFVQPEYFAMHT